jgi:hypothetical protein
MNTEITNWTYQKGELAEKRFFNIVIFFGFLYVLF